MFTNVYTMTRFLGSYP